MYPLGFYQQLLGTPLYDWNFELFEALIANSVLVCVTIDAFHAVEESMRHRFTAMQLVDDLNIALVDDLNIPQWRPVYASGGRPECAFPPQQHLMEHEVFYGFQNMVGLNRIQ